MSGEQWADAGSSRPNTSLYGRRILVYKTWKDGSEIDELWIDGILEEINTPFDFKVNGRWYSIGESYNCDLTGEVLELYHASDLGEAS